MPDPELAACAERQQQRHAEYTRRCLDKSAEHAEYAERCLDRGDGPARAQVHAMLARFYQGELSRDVWYHRLAATDPD